MRVAAAPPAATAPTGYRLPLLFRAWLLIVVLLCCPLCCSYVQVKRSETIEIGRVVCINYGPLAGKIATIVDVVDQARALVDGPYSVTGVRRQTIPTRNLSLTAITVPIARGVREGVLKRQLDSNGVLEQWKATSWARKAARHEQRTKLSDFQRFQLMILRKQRSKIVGGEYAKLRREFNKKREGASSKKK